MERTEEDRTAAVVGEERNDGVIKAKLGTTAAESARRTAADRNFIVIVLYVLVASSV
jgi:hypothetical protein